MAHIVKNTETDIEKKKDRDYGKEWHSNGESKGDSKVVISL